MPLAIGERLGPYEVLGPIGAGGMGQVFRARDSRLNRDVAIKSLPPLFATDPERVARFGREANLLASLNHPNIAAIYGVEERHGTRHLVLELVPGESLAYRIAAAPMSLAEALVIARQIAEALEAAHEKGIVHRDLKPGNVMLTPDGVVKVLDFGLAKAVEPESGSGAISGIDNSPTMTRAAATADGMIIGTAAYMAPEQAKGQGTDKRADVWAFGCVMFEMLTGKKAYEGEDVSETLAAVLRGEPDWTLLPAATPPFLERLLRRSLEKDRKKRLPDISIARYEIDEFLAGRAPASVPTRPAVTQPPRSKTALVAAASALGAALVTAAILWFAPRTDTAPGRIAAFEIRPPANSRAFIVPIGPAIDVLISRGGSLIVYRVRTARGTALAMRRVDETESTILPGTNGAISPSLSPDGTKVAFQLEGRLMALTIGAPEPVVVSPLTTTVIGTRWLDRETILFAQRAIFKVAAGGGTPEKLFEPETATTHYTFPEVLPDGAVLVTANDGAQRHIKVRTSSGEQKTVVENASFARFAAGHLLFVQNNQVVSARFDASSHQIDGPVVPVGREIALKLSGAASFDVSADGTLVGMSGDAVPYRSRFIWKTPSGDVAARIGTEDADYPRYPRLSPDGRRLAATLGVGSRGELWVFDLDGARPPLRITDAHHNVLPSWMPDGQHVIFRRVTAGVLFGAASEPEGLMVLPADGSSTKPQSLVAHVVATSPVSTISRDGQWLVYSDATTTGFDILMRPLGKTGPDAEPKPWLSESFSEHNPAFSPDGKWIAYVSERTGSPEIWVRPFPGPGAPIRVSVTGGQEPVWARSGKELYFQEQDKLMAAAVTSGSASELQFTAPRMLFRGGFVPYQDLLPRTYDVAADGRFLMIEDRPAAKEPVVTVVLGWASTLKNKGGS